MQSSAQIIPFDFESREVRTLLIDDQPWFVAKDVAEILGYSNTRKAIKDHCKAPSMLKRNESLPLNIPPRGLMIIAERDVYRLIMRSKLPAAEMFEEWVVDEVLPAIRKHGHYNDEQGKMNTLIGQTIGTDGFRCLGAVIDGKLSKYPAPVRKSIRSHIWSQVHKAFSVVSAQDIPADKMDAARNFIAAYAVEGEWIGKDEGKEKRFTLTLEQARKVDYLLHSVAWVNFRWRQGIGKGVQALNRELYSSTFEHVDNMARAGRYLDAELTDIRQHFSHNGGLRPNETTRHVMQYG